MSTRGVISGRLFVSVDILFDEAWDDLTSEDRKQIIAKNIDLIDTSDLINELEQRGFAITEKEGEK